MDTDTQTPSAFAGTLYEEGQSDARCGFEANLDWWMVSIAYTQGYLDGMDEGIDPDEEL